MGSALAQVKQVEAWHELVHADAFADCHDQLCEFARNIRTAIATGDSGYEEVSLSLLEKVWVNQARMHVLDLPVRATEGDVVGLGLALRVGMTLYAVWNGMSYREVAERLFAGGPSDEEWHRQVIPRMIRDAELHRETFESILNEREGDG